MYIEPSALPFIYLCIGVLLLLVDVILTRAPAETATDEDMEKD